MLHPSAKGTHRRSRGARSLIILALGILLLPLSVMGREPTMGPIPPMGFKPLPPSVASQKVGALDVPATFPPEFDWRDAGIITAPKDQQTCGACWAFAATGCMEAMCLLAGAGAGIDHSEQYPTSCDRYDLGWGVVNEGCCGGTVAVFDFLKLNGAMTEASFEWSNGDHFGNRDCDAAPRQPGDLSGVMTWATVPCPASGPEFSGWRVETWTLISIGIPSVTQLKAALMDGPVWLGYHVYGDFMTYWYSGDPAVPYVHASGDYLGGHAVLLVGYDDSKSAWIVKNSWGVTGPLGNGLFLMHYTNNCDFGLNAAYITVAGEDTPVDRTTWGNIRAAFRTDD
jgi:hypothetical protein